MKITKARLVEIIKEEVAGLDEATFGGLFGKGPEGSERRGRRPKGRASNDPSYSGAAAMEDYENDMAEREIDSLGRTAPGHKVARVAIDRAAKMDAKSSEKDFERVMKWANDNDIATEKEIESASEKDFERVMKWANEEGIATEKDIAQAVVDAMKTMDSGMIAQIQEPLLKDTDFIKQLVQKINMYKHSKEEK